MNFRAESSDRISRPLDIGLLRSETPGVANRVHLNNAGAGLMPISVLNSMQSHLVLESQIGGYEAADQAQATTAMAYDAVAGLICSNPGNIAFCANATAAYSMALSSIPFEPGDKILTTQDDYVSNQLMFLSMQQRMGIGLIRAANLAEGGVDVGQMVELMDRVRPKLVSVTQIPTNSGLIQPVAEIGRACRDRGILYLVDGCQSLGQVEIDVNAIRCDFFTASFRKFLRGPRGIGFLFASDRVLQAGMQPLFPDLQGAVWDSDNRYYPVPGARRFEYWEFPYALVHGAGESARYAVRAGVRECSQRAIGLASWLREAISRIGHGVRVLDRGSSLGAIVTVAIPGRDPKEFRNELNRRKINASVSMKNFALIDFQEKGVEWALRLSPHYYNVQDELETAVSAIEELVSENRNS